MKKILLLAVLCITTYAVSFAQTPEPMRTTIRLNETTIVRDTAGQQYAYADWTTLLRSQKYRLRTAGKDHPGEFVLVPLSDKDIAARKIVTSSRTITPAIPYKPAESEQFKTGDIFRPFKEKAIDGEKFDMKKMPGKVFVINFWFIGCPPCRSEIPKLNEIVDHYKDNKDVVFIAICLDEAYDIKEFLKLHPYNYHILDDSRILAEKYGVHLYPTNVIVNKEGKVAYSSVSDQPSNPYWMKRTIDEALQGSAAAPATATTSSK